MDILSSDLLMSLFSAALRSYKQDSLLRPFPPEYISNTERDFDAVKSEVEKFPEFACIDWNNTREVDDKTLKLLKWILKPRRFSIKLSVSQKFTDILKLAGETEVPVGTKPDFVFEVVYNSQDEEKFIQTKGERDLLYAYHGSRTENFYSILHSGLHYHLNKTSLFGEGIYLSSDLRICQTYSPVGNGWEKSLLGNSLSCIAVCEVVDHPDVKCSVKRSLQNLSHESDGNSEKTENDLRNRHSLSTSVKTEVTNAERSFIPGSEGGKIPDKYYVVQNNDLVRVKYLLVHAPHAQKDVIRQLLTGGKVASKPPQHGAIRGLINRYQFFLVMLLYVVVIFFISMWNSKVLSNWWQRFTSNGDKDSVLL